MRRGYDDPQQHCMSCGAARSNEICSDDGIAMSRFPGMKRAEPCSDQSGENDTRSYLNLPCVEISSVKRLRGVFCACGADDSVATVDVAAPLEELCGVVQGSGRNCA